MFILQGFLEVGCISVYAMCLCGALEALVTPASAPEGSIGLDSTNCGSCLWEKVEKWSRVLEEAGQAAACAQELTDNEDGLANTE